ncbi:MAG TPA: carbon-nitrogen hydrolase family protein [Bacillota bacterium]|nr:carbon-nitrogen hydrolase family protein [Bacillota bacterium]
METESIKVAAFQFQGSGNIANNLLAIERGITEAARQKVRLLITQECALCGYPPVETESVDLIDFDSVNRAIAKIKQLAKTNNMYIALGTIKRSENNYLNSIEFITPDDEQLLSYSKRALWGWDVQNYVPGNHPGIYVIDGFKIGIRICYEIRFPEYFRELFKENVDLALVSFCDIGEERQVPKYELIKAHLITRAVENAMYVMSVNSISNYQLAPTCIINPDGKVLQSAPSGEEYLLVYEVAKGPSNFGRDGRIKHSKELCQMGQD